MRVLQLSCGSGLILKPGHLFFVPDRSQRQDFQCNFTVERNLLGFIDNSHASPPDLSSELEISKLF